MSAGERTMNTELTQREVGRILERLDQQDRNVKLATLETKEIAERLASETAATAKVFADALAAHTEQDTKQFQEIAGKLDQLLEYQLTQKGSVKVVLWMVGVVGAAIAMVAGYFVK